MPPYCLMYSFIVDQPIITPDEPSSYEVGGDHARLEAFALTCLRHHSLSYAQTAPTTRRNPPRSTILDSTAPPRPARSPPRCTSHIRIERPPRARRQTPAPLRADSHTREIRLVYDCGIATPAAALPSRALGALREWCGAVRAAEDLSGELGLRWCCHIRVFLRQRFVDARRAAMSLLGRQWRPFDKAKFLLGRQSKSSEAPTKQRRARFVWRDFRSLGLGLDRGSRAIAILATPHITQRFASAFIVLIHLLRQQSKLCSKGQQTLVHATWTLRHDRAQHAMAPVAAAPDLPAPSSSTNLVS